MKSQFALSLFLLTATFTYAQVEPTPRENRVPAEIRQNTEPAVVAPPPPPQPPPAEQAPKIIEDAIDFPDVEAEFPGGQEAMTAFIVENLQYPEVSREMNDQGVVYLSFIVEKDGTLSNIAIMKGVSAELDREAKRLIRLMPKWKPAEVKGKPVRARYQLPLKFKLD